MSQSKKNSLEVDPLEALEDVRQLRAIIEGLQDTIAFQSNQLRVARRKLASLPDVGELERLYEYDHDSAYAYERLRRTSGNWRIFQDSRRTRTSEVAALDRAVSIMRSDLQNSPELYRPSEFWEVFFGHNMQQLRDVGLSNFKVTVNQNYQNFIPRSLDDPKIKRLTEWFLSEPSIRPFLSFIENPDHLTDEGYLAQPDTQIFRNDPQQMALYEMLVVLGWEYCKSRDPLGICSRLEEPELGNPIRVHYEGKLISQDLSTSFVEVTDFLGPWRERYGDNPVSIIEIGGGYGRLAHAMMSTTMVDKYFVVDIPPALHVSRWYLEKLFPEKVIFEYRPFTEWDEVASDVEKSDIVFLLPRQIELIPDQMVDIGISVSSLHEMRLAQANNYLKQLARIVRHFIGSKQYWSYDNPHDDIVLKHEDYKIPEGFSRLMLKDDTLNPVFFVDVLQKQE